MFITPNNFYSWSMIFLSKESKKAFLFMKYDFPFPRYHRNIFYYMKYGFPFKKCFCDILEKENQTSWIEITSVIFWKRKIILHEIEIASVISWKRKIILHVIEIASWIPWKRKIILHVIEIASVIFCKRKIRLHVINKKCFCDILEKENHTSRIEFVWSDEHFICLNKYFSLNN